MRTEEPPIHVLSHPTTVHPSQRISIISSAQEEDLENMVIPASNFKIKLGDNNLIPSRAKVHH